MPFQSGDVIENPLTGERGVIRVAPADPNDHLLVADLHVRPGGAVVGEHVHPAMTEAFMVVERTLTVRVAGETRKAPPGTRVVVPPGTAHDWWNAEKTPAWVIVEAQPGERFEEMIRHLFFLAQDGRTDRRGRPSLLQAALLAREFDDVIRFTSPPHWVQRTVFALAAPIARMRGLRGLYPDYLERAADRREHLPPLPPDLGVAQAPGAAPGG